MTDNSIRDILIGADTLQLFCRQIFSHVGLADEDAKLVAEALVEADLRGVHSHGVILLPTYVRRLQAGGINPRPKVQVVRQTVASALVDGDSGPGQVVANRAMEIAIEKAGQAGTGTVGVLNSNHFGAGARWPMMALAHNMVGLAVTTTGAMMAPWGGQEKFLGTNPWIVAIPAGHQWPIVLDMATTVVAGGKLVWAAKRGEAIPLGWALDEAGGATTDSVRGLAGRLPPTGGYKGYGLAVVVDILAGALTGAMMGFGMTQALADPAQPLNTGHLFLAINVAAFISPEQFAVRVDDYISHMKQTSREFCVSEILLPGERAFRTEQERRATGIPLPLAVMTELEEIAGGLNIPGLPKLF